MNKRFFHFSPLIAALLLAAATGLHAGDVAEAGLCALPNELTVTAPADLSPALEDFREVCSGCNVKVKFVTPDSGAFLRLNLSDRETPEHPQGYRLEIAADGISIAARTPEGLFNGLQSLTVMLKRAPGRSIPTCRSMEAPGIDQRAASFSIRKCHPRQLADLKRFLRTLAALKYNRAFIEFGDNFPLPQELYPRNRYPLTEKQLREITRFAEDRFIRITPMLRVWSDCPILESRSDREALLEVPHPAHGLLTYCPRNPKLQELIRRTVAAQCRMLHPGEYFFRIDRNDLRFHFRKCPQCKNIPAEQIVSEHLKFLAGCVSEGNSTPGFILLNFPSRMSEKILAMLPSDTTVFGLTAPGRHPDAASAACREELENAILESYRAHARCFILLEKPCARGGDVIPISNTSPWLWYALVHGGNVMWSPENPAAPDDPAALFRLLFSNQPPDKFLRNAVPIPIAEQFNAALGSVEGFPRLNDPGQLEQMRKSVRELPEKFELTVDNGVDLHSALLSGDPRDKRFPDHIDIPLNNSTAEYLALLVTCSPPLQHAEFDPAGRGSRAFDYPDIAFVRFNYANGKSSTKKLRYLVGLADWNRRFSGYAPHFAVTGKDRYGRFFHFDCLRVKNPHPELPLKSFTFGSYRRYWLAPALLSASLLNAEAKTLSPAGKSENIRAKHDSPPRINIPRIYQFDFENAELGAATVEMRNARFAAADTAPQIDFPVDSEAPSHNHVLRIVVPAAAPENPDKTIDLKIDIPVSLRSSMRSIGFAAKVDHPEYLVDAAQILLDSRRGSTYAQPVFPCGHWRRIWTSLSNPDLRSRKPLRDPLSADTRSIVFRFRGLPQPVTVSIDDIGHSRWNLHTSPEITEP